jgi:cytidylate kinase
MTFGPVVTVSATYGAGGSVIAPRLAADLGLPFIDRMISADMSQGAAAAMRSQESLCEGEQAASPSSKFLSYFARAASVGVVMAPDPLLEDDSALRAKTEEPLRGLTRGDAGVVLGRAGAIVLATRPRAFHVRLDGPIARRLAWAADFEDLDQEAAARRQAETDKARTMFVKRLYRVDPSHPGLYHMVIDPTVLGVDRAVHVLVSAAQDYFEANP